MELINFRPCTFLSLPQQSRGLDQPKRGCGGCLAAIYLRLLGVIDSHEICGATKLLLTCVALNDILTKHYYRNIKRWRQEVILMYYGDDMWVLAIDLVYGAGLTTFVQAASISKPRTNHLDACLWFGS